jgi:hypothetical protein
MLTIEFRRMSLALLLVGSLGAGACKGQIGGSQTPSGSGNSSGGGGSGGTGAITGGGPTMVDPGNPTATTTPIAAALATPICRKVKDLLVGSACTDDDVNTLTTMGAAGLQQLISTWMTDTTYQAKFSGKLVPFFRNMFQQTGFTATQDFKNQLLQNGGFDFGPYGTSAVGDDVYFKLVQNLQDSFALTAWQMVSEGDPFTNVLTTQRFVMTTGLKSVYTQIEMADDEPYNFSGGRNATPKLQWKLDYVDTIPLTDALNPSSPNYMIFDDEKPASGKTGFGGGGFTTCQGVGDAASGTTVPVVTFGASGTGVQTTTGGVAQLFQRIIGYTPRYPFAATPDCWEHSSKPYMTDADVADWGWVTIMPKQSGDSYIQPYDLPSLRTATTLKLVLPRVGFYTTPAFLALWNTNDSNQHRVTANQTLLAALGQSFTSDSTITPLSEAGLDAAHTTTSGECYGCHKSLDPLRMFWGNQLDFNDRNDFVAQPFNGAQPNPRPAAGYVSGFAFGDVNNNTAGTSMASLGSLLLMVTDQDPTSPLPLFPIAVTQQLCYWANSNACNTSDPEFRRVVSAFISSNYNFPALIKELFASPLITGVGATATYPLDSNGSATVPISIARQAHLCAALSNRLGVADLCALGAAVPTTAQNATLTIAGSIAADAFSRGAQTPVTPAGPDLFYRAASEMLCENVAVQVVDPSGGATAVFSSSDVTTALPKMVENVMGINVSDPLHDQLVKLLQTHYTAVTTAKGTATNALRSTFALACESPTSLGIGL